MSFGLYGRRMIKSDETEVTVENVIAILNKALPYHWENRSEIQYLWYYYRGLQPILNREKQVVQRFVIKSWRTGRMRLCPSSLAI